MKESDIYQYAMDRLAEGADSEKVIGELTGADINISRVRNIVAIASLDIIQRDYYVVFGISKTASPDEIRRTFRRKALEYHPDRNINPGAAARFKQIHDIYQTLRDPQRRAKYDRIILTQSRGRNSNQRDGARRDRPEQKREESSQSPNDLSKVISSLNTSIEKHRRELSTSEKRTRQVLIDPLLEALGWNLADLNEVYVEYNVGRGRADYAMFAGKDTPSFIVEAKKLGRPLVEGVSQSRVYCNELGIQHFVVTNGLSWAIYEMNTSLPVFEFSIASATESTLSNILWLQRDNFVRGNDVREPGYTEANHTSYNNVARGSGHGEVNRPRYDKVYVGQKKVVDAALSKKRNTTDHSGQLYGVIKGMCIVLIIILAVGAAIVGLGTVVVFFLDWLFDGLSNWLFG